MHGLSQVWSNIFDRSVHQLRSITSPPDVPANHSLPSFTAGSKPPPQQIRSLQTRSLLSRTKQVPDRLVPANIYGPFVQSNVSSAEGNDKYFVLFHAPKSV